MSAYGTDTEGATQPVSVAALEQAMARLEAASDAAAPRAAVAAFQLIAESVIDQAGCPQAFIDRFEQLALVRRLRAAQTAFQAASQLRDGAPASAVKLRHLTAFLGLSPEDQGLILQLANTRGGAADDGSQPRFRSSGSFKANLYVQHLALSTAEGLELESADTLSPGDAVRAKLRRQSLAVLFGTDPDTDAWTDRALAVLAEIHPPKTRVMLSRDLKGFMGVAA